MDDVWGYFLWPPYSTTPTAVTTNKDSKVSENIQKKEGGPDCTVSNNEFSSTGNESQKEHTDGTSQVEAIKRNPKKR